MPESGSRALRIGVAGFWHVHAVEYARLAQAHPRTELVGVWDDDPGRGFLKFVALPGQAVGQLPEDRQKALVPPPLRQRHECFPRA